MPFKKVYPSKLYIRILVRIVFFFFVRLFHIKAKLPTEVKKLKPPFLILSNHVGLWDPFVVGYFLPHFTHFVSSDAAFRNKFQRFFLTRLGTIPKKKNIRDTKVIRDIASVISQGENVGIFPSGVRTWAGNSLLFDQSIAKLIRLLNIPIVISVLRGMNLFNPRWSIKLRKTKVEVEYKLLFTVEQLNQLSDFEIFEQLKEAITHNEIEYQCIKMNKIRSKHKAEYINYTLYLCPDCHSIDSFRAKGNEFYCTNCQYDILIDSFGFFKRKSKGILFFDNIQDWYDWEEEWLLRHVTDKFNHHFEQIIFEDADSSIYRNTPKADFEYLGKADVRLYVDKIEIIFKSIPSITMNFDDLQTINPQVNENLEIFYRNEAYRIIGSRKGVSGLKWEVAMNAIWNIMGQKQKLSAHIKHLSQ